MLWIWVFFLHVYVCTKYVLRAMEVRGGCWIPGVIHSCKLPCGFWESNLGPLEEQPVDLTAKCSLSPAHDRQSEEQQQLRRLLPCLWTNVNVLLSNYTKIATL